MYALHDLVLEVESDGPTREDVHRVLEELSWAPVAKCARKPALRLSVRTHDGDWRTPPGCREVLRTDDFRGFEEGDDYFLTDGSSAFHLQPLIGEAHARIAEGFFSKPPRTQANFWCFGLLKLLRPRGLYSLHAAAVASEDPGGLLLVGPSGSAKSTLAIGLIRAGWNFLSDDAVLLRTQRNQVEAIACRRSFYVDAARAADYTDCGLDGEEPDSTGAGRVRLRIDRQFGEQYAARCFPRIVIFPTIKAQPQSKLRPMPRLGALRLLLTQSAPQLFDRSTMAAHLDVLTKLLEQAEAFELDAGADLYHAPARLVELIHETRGAITCRAS